MRKFRAALLVSAITAFAQAPLTFEVASIKPAGPLNPAAIQSGKMRMGMKIDGAIVDIGSFSLTDLIRTAYEVKDYQIRRNFPNHSNCVHSVLSLSADFDGISGGE